MTISLINFRTLLTFLVVTINTALVVVPGIPPWVTGVGVAVVTGFAAIGVVPPQLRSTGYVLVRGVSRKAWTR